MGAYQTIEFVYGVKVSEEFLRTKNDWFGDGKQETLLTFLLEGDKLLPDWLFYDCDYNIIGWSSGYLFEVLDRMSMPGCEEINIENIPVDNVIKFLKSIGIENPQPKMWIINSW